MSEPTGNQYRCEKCRIAIDKKVLNNSSQCAGGHSNFGSRRWEWDLCCKCYVEGQQRFGANREWVIGSGCDHCIKRLEYCLTGAEKDIRDRNKAAAAVKEIELQAWKAKGFDYIPFDEEIDCISCERTFDFPVGEQVFYKSRNFSAPRRCKNCRGQRNKK